MKTELPHPKNMRRIVIESPYRGPDDLVAEHVAYAEECMLDALNRQEAPFASHLLYTRVLDDSDQVQRAQGINAGHAWLHVADAVVVYKDLGISEGMRAGIKTALFHGKKVEYRKIRRRQVSGFIQDALPRVLVK